MDNYVGKRLDGRYEVNEIIGVGGMSVVYKAYDRVDDRIVAVKVLKDEFLNNEDFKRRFKNESKAIALLSHENIVRVYDVNFGEKLQYIVEEYIDGITLKEYINKQGSITWNDALYFMTQILTAVQHAHDKGIVHRDIKPQNIILLANGKIKVTDFGIARFSRSDTKTLTEQAIGSVHYIAPEQAKGELTDEKADIYSLGVVLYEMLAGKVPFDADSAVSVALMQIQSNAERLTSINPDIPEGLEQICIHAMQKNSQDRYQSATEMLLDIEEIIKNPNTKFNYVNKIEMPKKVTPVHIDDDYPEQEYDESDEYIEEDGKKKKVVIATLIGIIVMVIAVTCVIVAFTQGFNTKSHPVENFVGFSYDQLRESTDYKYEFVAEYKESNDADAGIVIEQKPEAGTKVLSDATITLIVASNGANIAVPNVEGLTAEMAQQTLSNNGLNVYRVAQVPSDTVEEGKVIGTKPRVSTVVSSTEEIVIYVSSGASTTVIQSMPVPDIKGLNKNDAKAFLNKYGFTNVTFKSEYSDAKEGVAISQEPVAGLTAKVTDTITVVISNGQTTTTEKNIKCSLSIKLPTVTDADGVNAKDTLIIMIDGEKYSSTKVNLDGSRKEYAINVDAGKKSNIKVSLKNTDVMETKSFDGKNNKSYVIDFSSASSSETTTKQQQTTQL